MIIVLHVVILDLIYGKEDSNDESFRFRIYENGKVVTADKRVIW